VSGKFEDEVFRNTIKIYNKICSLFWRESYSLWYRN
jgi:hypothetical protein